MLLPDLKCYKAMPYGKYVCTMQRRCISEWSHPFTFQNTLIHREYGYWFAYLFQCAARYKSCSSIESAENASSVSRALPAKSKVPYKYPPPKKQPKSGIRSGTVAVEMAYKWSKVAGAFQQWFFPTGALCTRTGPPPKRKAARGIAVR